MADLINGAEAQDQLLSVLEAAGILGISRYSVHRLIRTDRLKAARVGGVIVIPRRELEALIVNGRDRRPAPGRPRLLSDEERRIARNESSHRWRQKQKEKARQALTLESFSNWKGEE